MNKNVEKKENKSKKKQIKIKTKDNVKTSAERENPGEILRGKKEVVISKGELDTDRSALKRRDKSKFRNDNSIDGRNSKFDVKADTNECDDEIGNHDNKTDVKENTQGEGTNSVQETKDKCNDNANRGFSK